MTITVCPVTPSFAAEIGDVDLSAPSRADVQAIKERSPNTRAVFPDQRLSQDSVDFASHFGPLETPIALASQGRQAAVRKEFADVRTSIRKPRCGARNRGSACSKSATGCGRPIRRSNGAGAGVAALCASIPTIGGHTNSPTSGGL